MAVSYTHLNPIDIGEVGNVIGCLTERITEALELQITPIVSPLAKELGTHKPLNVNADLACLLYTSMVA